MSLHALPGALRDDPVMTRVVGMSNATLAVATPAQAIAVAGVMRLGSRRPVLVVAPTGVAAEQLAHDLALFVDGRVELFPAWETLPFERVSPEVATMGQRLAVLSALVGSGAPDGVALGGARGWEAAGGVEPVDVVVAPVKALLQRLGPWRSAARPVVVAKGTRVDPGELVARLVGLGYRREPLVEHRGELAVRGGIVDVFPPTDDLPVRIDLWGDDVDRLTRFDVADQRSVEDVSVVRLTGCRELVPDEAVRARATRLVEEAPWGAQQWRRLADGHLFDGMESWLPWLLDADADADADPITPDVDPITHDAGVDPTPAAGDSGAGASSLRGELLTDLLGPGSIVVVVEPGRVRDRAAELADEEAALADALAQTWGLDAGADAPRLHATYDRLLARYAGAVLTLPLTSDGGDAPALESRGWQPVLGDPAALSGQVGALVGGGFRVVVCAASRPGAERLATMLDTEGVPATVVDGEPTLGPPGVHVVTTALDRGFVLPTARLAVLAESDLTGRRRPHRQARTRARPVDGFFDDLAPGSYVVHRQHGVARYGGMVTRTMGGVTRDYLLLEYRGDDKLYLPTDQIELLTPYAGGESPTVSRLGGSEWQRTRAKARAAVHEIAEELVALYRTRLQVPGHAFSPDTPWQAEVESAFPFIETADQLRAIEEVKADMERPQPMDRLVCGDVGFGKTEVAIRAVFKAVQDGRQAAVLVPTTLLASQHFQTFSDRFEPYPVRVELLSRFLTPAQGRSVLAGLADGSVDVVVGTHRLLASDVSFAKLGLLVVDEEQRFGVSHKEAIKALAEGVDVLTLSASPIPRTLEMALTGIRDLSMVNTPPAARRPILTYVGEYDEGAVAEAIRRELLREGQVFFVHNRVHDIEQVAERVRRLAPEARVAVAHGQMDEGALEQVVLDFWQRRFDVLVCTTIIESGIDMPTVNTLVVDRADLLGLGQLHQLRGRVGRAGQRAYAYLFHPPDHVLSEQAYERLRTIGDHTDLGSGFKIALRDLQIRGAGNLLGRDQSGHVAAVGYDLYVQLVSEAVAELKGEPRPTPVELSIDVPDAAHLPAQYIEAEDVRLEAYRRLADVRTADQVDDVRAEWTDRFGPPPPQAEALLEVARLRAECLRLGIEDLAVQLPRGTMGGGRATAKLTPVVLPASASVRLRRLAPGATYLEDQRRLLVPLAKPSDGRYAPVLVELLRQLVPDA